MTDINLAKNIVDYVGGVENINGVTSCQTRLRFNLKDKSKVAEEDLKMLDGVLGTNETETQYQVIIGTHVEKILRHVESILKEDQFIEKGGEKSTKEQNQSQSQNVFVSGVKFLFEYLSTSFTPILIAILGSGVIKGLDILFQSSLNLYAADSGIGKVMSLIGDVPFYFLPFFIAYGAAEKLNTSVPLALVMAGSFMHPSIINAASAGESWMLFGMEVPLISYNGTVLPILLSVLLMSCVYKRIDRIVPNNVRILIVPIVVFVIMIPINLLFIGPAGYYLSDYVAIGLEKLFNLNAWIAGFVYGALRQVLVMTGLHLGLTPIILENIRVFGGDYLMPIHAVSAMAVAGTALGIYFKAKKSETKATAIGAFIPGFIGVTEPGIFSLAIRFVKPWIPIAIGGGLAGAYVAGMGATSVAVSLPGPLSFAIFSETLGTMVVGWIIAFISSFIIAYFVGVDEIYK